MIKKKKEHQMMLLFCDSVGIQVIRLEFLCIVKEKHS